MNPTQTCSQTGCTANPTHRFTWPGKNEVVICESHKQHAERVAAIMGFHLQFIPIPAMETL